jgi:hypothetical protein
MSYSKRHSWLFLISLLLLFIPYVYISRYANPVADDFVYGAKGRANTLSTLLIPEYLNSNGRYISNIFVFLNPIGFNSFFIYKLVPVVLIILLIVSTFVFVRVMIGKDRSNTGSFTIALLISDLFLYQMPILSEGIYWYTGAVTYQLATVFMITYLSMLVLYTQGRFCFKSKAIHTVLLTLLLIAGIGFTEIHMIVFVIFSGISLFIVIKNNLRYKPLFIYLLAITCIFSGIMFFSPGNENRASMFVNNHRFLYSFALACAQTLRFFLEWTASVPLLALSFLYYFLNKKLSEDHHLFSVSFYLSPFYSIAMLFGVIFIAVFPPYWATGMLGQHRTVNVAYYLFLMIWFINLTVCFNFYKNELPVAKVINRRLQTILLIVTVVALFFSKNGYDLLTDIFYGRAQAYDVQMTARYMQLQAPADTIYFDPIQDPPKSLFLYDVKEDPANWLNRSYTLYFECTDKSIIKRTGQFPQQSKIVRRALFMGI